tara:strand:- start:284 stop:595 length:312 start_codon:yes stop_codon:yes gene_type:complete
MITKTLNKYDFINEFETSAERKDQFSYNALSALYDYIEGYYEDCGEAYEFDMIAICCEWAEYNTIEQAAKDYSVSPNELKHNTYVLECDNGHVMVFQNFNAPL